MSKGINLRGENSGKKGPKRFTKEELAAAKRRLDASPDRGSDEEYFADIVNDYKTYKEGRRKHDAE